MIRSISIKADVFGAIASLLCLAHCFATPILFFSHSSISSEIQLTPIWWETLDFSFLAISFLAIYRSTQTTTKRIMKYLLWSFWALLFTFVLNEKMSVINISGIYGDLSAVILSLLHIYNLSFCQCKDDNCCVHN